MLSLRAVNQFYGQNHILWNVDLDLPAGSCTCVIGRTGMGKTTLVNCIMGYLPVNSGAIIWQEQDLPPLDLLHQPVERRAALGISYVPQGRQNFSQLSVEDNLHIALLAGETQQRTIPAMIFDLFPRLWSLRHRRSGDLSSEEQQQLALARALVLQPRLLILDEPTDGMSPWLEEEMEQLIHRLNRDFGLTILLLEQHLPFVRLVADSFLLLHHGRAVANGSVAQLNEHMADRWLAAPGSA